MSEDRQENLDFDSTDKPADKDKLEISKHIDGLSKFLTTCDMPMTVSIQGEWGSGKSSIMKQVMSQIDNMPGEGIVNIWFDTWQFSQFSLDDQLPIILLERLISKIGESDGSNKFNPYLEKIMASVKVLGGHMATAGKVGVNALSELNLNLSIFTNLRGEVKPKKDVYKEIEEFKSKFENLIKESKRDRFVIYIDDLDRLTPKKAVELLEVLKIFLDVKKCVFVLAIDHDVVLRGVADKYGFDTTNPEESEKGGNFFDKIIQVPYSVPLAYYDLEEFIGKFLEKEDLSSDKETIRDYEDLVVKSIGKNPRSIKRILNMFKLNMLIKTTDKEEEPDLNEDLLLFMFTCMQNEYPHTYSYITDSNVYSTRDDNIKENIRQLVDRQIDDEFLNSDKLREELDKPNTNGFLRKVTEISNKFDSNTLDKLSNYSRNTFISKAREGSGMLSFNDLGSFLDYHFNKTGGQMRDKTGDIETIYQEISKLSEELEVEYLINKNISTVKFKVGNSVIAEIILRKTVFSVECNIGSKLKSDKDIRDILDKHGLKISQANKVTFNVVQLNILENDEYLKDLLRVISMIIEGKA